MAISIKESIEPVFKKMDNRDKGVVVSYLLYGKKLSEMDITDEKLEQIGTTYRVEEISRMMNEAFVAGLGIWDIFTDRDDNYGKQLEICINNILCKALNKAKPKFNFSYEDWEGIIERERWIVNAFIERFWEGLSDKDKLELVSGLEKEFKKAGIPYEEIVKKIMAGQASLTLIRSLLGFRFHIFLAQIANALAKSIFGRGLSLAANAALQRTAASIFGGPFGWTMLIITIITSVVGLINPREWDKYIPCVFLIGLYRERLI